MAVRGDGVDAAARRSGQQVASVLRDLRAARIAGNLPQSTVARALGWSRQRLGAMESGLLSATPVELARWGAAVGLDVVLRSYPAGGRLRDAGQLRLLAGLASAIGGCWQWRTEVPVSRDPWDRRAIDAVLACPQGRVAVEAIARLGDAQAQVRAALLKAQTAEIDRIVMVLSDTRHNRLAVREAGPTLLPAFPCPPRATLRALRSGSLPEANGLVLL